MKIKCNKELVKAHPSDAGYDLAATHSDRIFPGERALISTGVMLALPNGYEAQIRSRSGNALKKGLMVLNSPGTIDSGYRGEIGVILLNTGSETVDIDIGDRVAQMIIQKLPDVELVVATIEDETERGATGFGDSGE